MSRSGDRAANSARYIIAINRCLKRYIAREVFNALPPRPAVPLAVAA